MTTSVGWLYATEPKGRAVKSARTAACAHHWIISPPDGPASDAYCKNCGDKRVFSNFDPRFTYGFGVCDKCGTGYSSQTHLQDCLKQ